MRLWQNASHNNRVSKFRALKRSRLLTHSRGDSYAHERERRESHMKRFRVLRVLRVFAFR